MQSTEKNIKVVYISKLQIRFRQTMNKLASLDKFITNWDIAINCIKCYNIKRINTVSFGYYVCF